MIDEFPPQFLSKAYLSLAGEPAWSASEALKVIDWATKANLAVFGVEVWLPTKPGPTIPMPYLYAFGSEPTASEAWEQFVLRANAAAKEYIRTFDWDPQDTKHQTYTPFFNVTIDDH